MGSNTIAIPVHTIKITVLQPAQNALNHCIRHYTDEDFALNIEREKILSLFMGCGNAFWIFMEQWTNISSDRVLSIFFPD